MNNDELTLKEMQLHSTDAWNKNYERYEKGNWIGIQYPTEVLVSFVSNLRKYNADAETYFQDSGKEYSIRNNFSGRALDIGFGSIANLKMVSDKGFECHGLEVSKEAVIRGENVMVEQRAKGEKWAGKNGTKGTQTLAGFDWYWRQDVVPTADKSFVKVTINVFADEKLEYPVYELSTYLNKGDK